MMRYYDTDNLAKINQMMRENGYGCGNFVWGNYHLLHWTLALITWILVMVLLIGLIRWVWKKGGK